MVSQLEHGIATNLKTCADKINTVIKHLSQNQQRGVLSGLDTDIANYARVLVAVASRCRHRLLLLLGGIKSFEHARIHLAQKSRSRAQLPIHDDAKTCTKSIRCAHSNNRLWIPQHREYLINEIVICRLTEDGLRRLGEERCRGIQGELL